MREYEKTQIDHRYSVPDRTHIIDYGFVILEKRFVDVTRRYGIMDGYIRGWEIAFEIKESFESRMGCSVYDVLPDIGETTLLTPKPWKPPVKRDDP